MISLRVAPSVPDLSISASRNSLKRSMCILRNIGVSSNPRHMRGGCLRATAPTVGLAELSLVHPFSCLIKHAPHLIQRFGSVGLRALLLKLDLEAQEQAASTAAKAFDNVVES
eukprot:scaffold215078_cov31-Tisochrysis_lutea.AAC.3